MKKTKIKIMLIFMLVITIVSNTVFAAPLIDETKTGSIEITALSQKNQNTAENTGIAGVEYTLYLVNNTVADKEAAENYITANNTQALDAKTTGIDGKVKFENLVLGRYYLKVTKVPTATNTGEYPESFVVDVPMTNTAGTDWIYDIQASPKIQVARGNVELVKKDGNNANAPMKGIQFKLQVSTEDGVWEDYNSQDESITELILTTDDDGKILIENLPMTYNEKVATFRFVEITTNEGYIMDNKYPYTINIQGDGKVVITDTKTDTSVTYDDKGQIEIINEKPTLEKTVKKQDDTYGKVTSKNIADTVSYRLFASIPANIDNMTTYKITDTLPTGVKLAGNIVVKGLLLEDGSEVVIPTDEYAVNNLEFTFDTQKISKYTNIIITYDATISENVVIGEAGNESAATLEYTNNVGLDGTEISKAQVTDTVKFVTGGLRIKKTNAQGEVLKDAKFKIATTKENAKAGTFIKDTTGNDIELVTGEDGIVTIEGLAYEDNEDARTYYLVETQAPKYMEDGEEKSYKLLSSPEAVIISGTSHQDGEEVEIINVKPISLPLTGGIGTILFTIVGISLILIAKNINKDKVKN